jgi:hypothetical protein
VEFAFNGRKTMKALVLIGLAGLSLGIVGCARPGEFFYTPAYTAQEHGQQIARNWDYEGKQAMDDLDHLLLLNPPSRLTIWSVR